MARGFVELDPMDLAGYQLDPISGDIVDNLHFEGIDLENLNFLDPNSSPANPYLVPEASASGEVRERQSSDGWATEDTTPRTTPSPSNNYGFVSGPMGRVASMAGAAPGPLGLAGKGFAGIIGVQNAVAKNAARGVMGLPEKSVIAAGLKGAATSGILGGIRGPDKGLVADIDINGQRFAAGLGAVDQFGRTMMTPDEAAARARAQGVSIKELTPAEAKAERKADKAAMKELTKTEKQLEQAATSVSEMSQQAKSSASAVDQTPAAVTTDRDPIQAGMGLYDISPSFREAVETKGTKGTIANAAAGEVGLSDRAQQMAETMERMGYGDLGVNSGARSAATNAAAGGARGSQHMQGNAMDLATRGLSDLQKAEVLDSAMVGGAKGIGLYNSGAIHVDVRDNPASWGPAGYTGTNVFGNAPMSSMPGWAQDNLQAMKDAQGHQYLSMYGPTPTARPEPEVNPNIAMGTPTTGVPGMANTIANADIASMSLMDQPADVRNWSADEKTRAAQTLAGEIDLGKTDLNTPVGRAEAMGIMSTIENRAAKTGSVIGAINAPNQYSTWNNTSAATTAMKNYELNPDLYNGLVDNFLSDPKSNIGATSYYNASIANPGWADKMTDIQTIGPHTFGSLPEYSVKSPETFMSTPQTGPTPSSKPELNTGVGTGQVSSAGMMSSPETSKAETKSNETNTNSQSSSSGNNSGNSGSNNGGGGDSSGHGGQSDKNDKNDNSRA